MGISAAEAEAALEALERQPAQPAGKGAYVCEVCGADFEKSISLRNHQRIHGGAAAGGEAGEGARERPKAPPAPAGAIKAEVDKFVSNTTVAATFLYPLAPHLAVTIAGVQDPTTQEWVVRSRVAVAGELLAAQARRDARVLLLLRRYNALFEGAEIFDVAFSLAAAAAVDAAAARAALSGASPREAAARMADFEVRLPMLPAGVRPIPMVIGDALAFVASQEGPEPAPEAPAPRAAANGASRRRSRRQAAPRASEAEVVPGGVENT